MNLPCRVLLVDDVPVSVEPLKRALQKAKYQVVVAKSSKEGVAFAPYVDVLFIDLRLPDRNGIELLREIREEGVKAPVFIYTSHPEDLTPEAVKDLGVVEIFQKGTVELGKLVEKVALARIVPDIQEATRLVIDTKDLFSKK